MSSDPGAGDIFSKLRAKFRGEEEVDGQRKLNKILNKLHEQKEISDREFSMMEGILDFDGTRSNGASNWCLYGRY